MYYINYSKSLSYLDNGIVTEVSSSSASPSSGQASTGWSPPHTSHPVIGIKNNTFLPINSNKVNGYVNLYVKQECIPVGCVPFVAYHLCHPPPVTRITDDGQWTILCNGFEITFVLEKHVVEDDVLFTNHLVEK